MSEHDEDLKERIAELEGRVAALESRLDADADPVVGARADSHTPEPRATSHEPAPSVEAPAAAVSEPAPARTRPSLVHLVDKIGIALLLLGVGFLLKYSYDQGWLTETLRVILGGATGLGLLAAGYHQREENRPLSAVLNGGAIATFYGTIYAAFELYELLPANVALGSTIGVTMLAFVLSVRQEQPALASIATIGGFATPFLMEGGPDPIALSIFAIIVLTGATAIYLFKGWKSLLTTATLGGFCVIGIAVDDSGTSAETLVSLAGLSLATAFAGAIPAIRSRYFDGKFMGLESFFAVAAPFTALPIVHAMFEEEAAFTAIATAIFGAIAYGLSLVVRAERTFFLIALLLAVMTFGTLIGVEPIGLAAAAGAVAFAWLGARASAWLYLPSFVLSASVAAAGFVLAIEESGELFSTSASLFLPFVVAVFVAIGAGLRARSARWLSWYVAAAAGMAVVASQLEGTADGLITGLWGIWALGALIVGFARDNGPLQGLGIGSVLLTSGKLLFFDLESVDTLVRVGLFMAMGAAMLFVSYLVPRWQNADESTGSSP